MALALVLVVVKPVNRLMAARKTEPEVIAPTTTCRHCLSSIPEGVSVWTFCTYEVGAAA